MQKLLVQNIINAFTLFFAVVGYFLESTLLLSICSYMLLFCIIRNVYQKQKQSIIFKNWFCPSYILLIGLIIVCFQTIININWGVGSFIDYYRIYYKPYLSSVTYIGIISILSYLIGHNLNVSDVKSSKTNHYTLWPWLITLPVLFILFISNIDLVSFITGTSYGGSGAYDRIADKSSYFEQLLDVNLVIITAIITYRNIKCQTTFSLLSYLKSFPLVFWVVFCLYVLLRLLSGDRGPVLYSLCLIFYSYLMVTRHKFKFVSAVGILFVASFFTTIIGFVRDGNLNKTFTERFENAIQQDSKGKPSIIPATQELANSSNTIYIASKAMDDPKEEYALGKYSFYAIIGSVPGSSSVLSKVFGVKMRDTMSSEFITIYDRGNQYGFGLGTSPMAEFFLEFDIWGCIIGFILTGWLFKFIDVELFTANSNTPLWLIIFILKLSSVSIYIARSSVAGCISKALYIIIIFFVLNTVFKLLKFR